MKTSAREKEKLNESKQQQARSTVFVTRKKKGEGVKIFGLIIHDLYMSMLY